jgi:hypothetical protein
MSAWLKRFSLHLAAAVGATGVFVVAAAVGANQTRQLTASPPPPTIIVRPPRTPLSQRRPAVEVTPSPAPSAPNTAPPNSEPAPATNPRGQQRPTGDSVRPERSLAGTIRDVQPDSIEIVGPGGRAWRVEPSPGALIRLNGKAAHLEALQPGDSVVILGQAQPGPGLRFLAHAITARSH